MKMERLPNAVALAWIVFNRQHPGSSTPLHTLMLGLAAAGFLVANTIPVAAILSVTEHGNLFKVWGRMFLLTFPVMYAVYSSYRHYFLAHPTAQAPGATPAAAGH